MAIDPPTDYCNFKHLLDWLQRAADRHPTWMKLGSLGETPEGRDIPLAVLGRRDTGDPNDRPAMWVDANLHASELTGSAAALFLIAHVLEGTTSADKVHNGLFERATLYVAPRLNPDGAEWCLDTGRFVRSVRRRFPDRSPDEHNPPGFEPKDIDGDGEILQMRVPDPNGAWRISDLDERLLVPRKPWDQPSNDAGPFFSLYPEGVFDEAAWSSVQRPLEKDRFNLDFNRNFPYGWQPPHQQKGAGEYPTSEPEVRAAVDFVSQRTNICTALTLHTFSGVLLRPFSDRPDSEMPRFDRGVYDVFGERCEHWTGYPGRSSYHYFREGEHDTTHGAFDDWAYAHRGLYSFTLELWSPWRRAGLDFEDDYPRFFGGRTETEDAELLAWNDESLDGDAFVDWHDVDHPQFDDAQVGGWRMLYGWRNPPPSMLEDECSGTPQFILDVLRSLPDPRLRVNVERLCDNEPLHRVVADLENCGYLPTDITGIARHNDIVPPTQVHLMTDDDIDIVDGDSHHQIDALDGWANVTQPDDSAFTWRGEARRESIRITWVVRGTGTLTVSWRGERIGVQTEDVEVDSP
jgi:murein tripeptide amidase MpaA